MPYTALSATGSVFACDPGWVNPSIVTPPFELFTIGSAFAGLIVWTPVPGIANVIEAGPLAASASWIAARSVHSPACDVAHTPLRVASARSAVELTTNTAPVRGVVAAEAADATPGGSTVHTAAPRTATMTKNARRAARYVERMIGLTPRSTRHAPCPRGSGCAGW